MHTKPDIKSKMDRALSKSLNLAVKEIIQIFLSANDQRVFVLCLKSLYTSKNLPQYSEYTNDLKILGGYLRSTQNLKIQDLNGTETNLELNRSYYLLMKAGKWLRNKWSPIVLKNVLQYIGSRDAAWYLMHDYFDISDKTRGGLYIGRILRSLLDA